MKILDMSAGRRAVWFNKKHPLALFLDIRASVKPDIVCDVKKLPPEIVGPYDLFVWDPPHVNCGKNSNMSRVYGHHTTKEILELLVKGSQSAWKIGKRNSLMAFKWNTHDISLKRVFDCMPKWEPLFGHLTKDGPRSQTYWVMFRRLK